MPRGLGSRVQQAVGQPVQQLRPEVGFHALDELEFPLSPVLRFGVGARRGRHLVIAELGERVSRRPVEHVDDAGGRDARDRTERPIADDGEHDVLEFRGHRAVVVAERQPDLGPGVGAGRQLEVPTSVRPTGAPAEGDLPRGESLLGCVVVDGFEVLSG